MKKLGAATFALAATLASPAIAVDQWGPQINLSQTATDSETGLNHRPLAIDTAGAVHLVWSERDGPAQNYRIWTRRLSAGTWGSAEMIVDWLASDPGVGGGAKYPALAATPDGDVHLFWHDYRIAGINNIEIYTKARPAAGAWNPARTADVRLTTTSHTETNGDNGYVPVPATAPDGTIHVAWYDFRYDGQAAEILEKTRPAGGAWDLTPGDTADHVVSDDPAHSELVATAVDAYGVLHAAWRSVSGGAALHYANRSPGTGLWSAPARVDSTGPPDSLAAVAGAPALAVDANGAVHLVWPDGRDGGRALFTRVRSEGGPWSTAERLTDPAATADEPSLASAPDGTLHLVWYAGLLTPDVFHRERPPAGAWDTSGASDFLVSEGSGAASTRPSVLAFAGSVIVLWKDLRDGNHEIYVRRGDAAATSAISTEPAIGPGLLAYPNPSRDGEVRFARRGGAASGPLAIHDAAGRLVRVVREDRWDGLDRAGRRVATGVYFVRARRGSDAVAVTVVR